MSKREIWELQSMQAAPLSVKIRLTKIRIKEWVYEYGEEGVYVSFSGGKDSTALLHIVREDFPNIPAVFVDTGLEYPEIREFVKTFDNVIWLKPKLNFKQVIKKYGYPVIGKEISQTIHECRSYMSRHDGSAEGFYRWQNLNGTRLDKDGKRSAYNYPKWKFLIDAPFKISSSCCDVMKKAPTKAYDKESGRHPITAQMAQESMLRTSQWLRHGCNAFDQKRPISNPMSFWTEQDVLLYLYTNQIPICSVYGDIVKETDVEGQLDLEDIYGKDMFDLGVPTLKTTGCKRTGCMFCGYGCQLEKPGTGRFERMRETHPKQYEWIMKPCEEGGLGYKEVIDWLNEHGNLDIRY